jgi:hypothetical protein
VVTEVNGRKVKLSGTAFDDGEKIDEGTHERVLVDHVRFVQGTLVPPPIKNDEFFVRARIFLRGAHGSLNFSDLHRVL